MDGENPALQLLQRHLAALAPGAIADIGKLAALLAGCLHQVEGTHAQGMHAGKLARMEAVRWEPPLLSFIIERHGAMALGSTRAPSFSAGAWISGAVRRAASKIADTASCSRAPGQ